MARKVETRPVRKVRKAPAKPAALAAPKRRAPSKPRARKALTPVVPEAPLPEVLVTTIEQLNRRYYDAFQSLNIEEISRAWWHDDAASCIHPGWDIRHGWPAIREGFEDIFRNTKSIRFALGDVRVRVNQDLAYVTCVENLVSEEGESGDYLGAVLATNIFERRRGEWRLIHHHASPFSADEATLPEGPLH